MTLSILYPSVKKCYFNKMIVFIWSTSYEFNDTEKINLFSYYTYCRIKSSNVYTGFNI